MRMNWSIATLRLALLFAIGFCTPAAHAVAALPVLPADGRPARPDCVQVHVSEVPGIPPAIVGDLQDILPTWAVSVEVEFWTVGIPRNRLFARAWLTEANFDRDWKYDAILDEYMVYQYLRGSGMGGLRIFPAGDYFVRVRGWNPTGFGEWCDVEGTAFSVEYPGALDLEITGSPDGTTKMAEITFRNNFEATIHEAEIRRNGRTVRKGREFGRFNWSWVIYDSLDDFEEVYLCDDPDSPTQELPDGEGYSIRVRSYSPVLRRWTAWEESPPFALARGIPGLPSEMVFSQEDFGGYFDHSGRPIFRTDYDNTEEAPLWNMIEIRQHDGNKTRLIRKEWIRKYAGYGYGWSGGGDGYDGWRADLPAGAYSWEVTAWNPGTNPRGGVAVKSGWKNVQIEGAGALQRPDGGSIVIGDSYWYRWQAICWDAVPNAYTYNLAVYRGDRIFRRYNNLDTARNLWAYGRLNEDAPDVEFFNSRGFLSPGDYSFTVQAVNRANPKRPVDLQTSEWSARSDIWTVIGPQRVPMADRLVGHVDNYPLYQFNMAGWHIEYDEETDEVIWNELGGFVGDKNLDAFAWDLQYEIRRVPLGIPKFQFTTENSSVSLPPGVYQWRVRGRNLLGWGPWSAFSAEFEIEDPADL